MKKPISATIDEELIKWIEKELGNNSAYRNKSHLIEAALQKMRREGKR
jgi:Arc/MetJ-type ribon-helix-helix transcriptional regulator